MRNATRFMTQLLGAAALAAALPAPAQETKPSPTIRTDAPALEAGDIEFKIAKLKIRNQLYQPGEHPTQNRGVKAGRNLDWFIIELEFEWAPTAKALKKAAKDAPQKQGDNAFWLDELVFDWRVAVAGSEDGSPVKQLSPTGGYNIRDNAAIRMSKSVRYVNVSDAGEHVAIMLIDGRTLERYVSRPKDSNFFCDVRVKLNGREVTHLSSWGDKFYANTAGETEKGGGDKEDRLRAPFIPRRGPTTASLFESEKVKAVNHALRARQDSPWEWSNDNAFETEIPAGKE